MKIIVVNVSKLIENSNCCTENDGYILYRVLDEALEKNKKVIISFKNIGVISSHFLSASIGQLYCKFSDNIIKTCLSIKEVSSKDKLLIKEVMKNSKIYFEEGKYV